MNFPDKIFAVGGAGKAIALELLESDWVIEDLLEPKPNPESVTVTIIDTAGGEENHDRERVADIRQRISEKEADLRDTSTGRTGTINVEYKLITDDIHLSGSIDLVGEDAVPRITSGNGMDEENWWIKEDHINENLDFAKGVVRKRGLGKAIYYKAYAEDDQISSYIDLPEKGQVAILAGLGGGTGSGILVDMARQLQRKQRTAEITVFGVLPNHTEGIKENTNAYAALSELEYLALNGEQVFKDRVLIPIDPTDFDGKIGNRIQTDQPLEELDEAIIYLIASYYNTQNLEDPFADAPQYAPFTIGIPQTLRYNVEAINDAREHFRDILTEKEEALQTEEEIYAKVERFLTKNYHEDIEPELRDLDQTDLKKRIEKVESLLEFDLFRELEYESVKIFDGIIADAREEGEDIVEQINIIWGSIRSVDTTGQEAGTFVDTIDEHLAEVLEQDLALIHQRMEILQRRKAIGDKRVRDAIEYLLGIGDSGSTPGVKLQRLESQLEDLEGKYRRTEDELEEIVSELEKVRDEQSSEIEERTTQYIQDIESDINRLQEVDVDAVQDKLSALSSELTSFQRSIENASSSDEIEQIDEAGVQNALDDLASELERAGVNFSDDRQAISASLVALKRTRNAFLVINQEESFTESIFPWKSDTEEAKDDAHKDYRVQRTKLNDHGVFQVSPPGGNYSSQVVYEGQGIIQKVEEQHQSLKQNVISALKARVESISAKNQERLDTVLGSEDPSVERIREIARSAIRQEIGETGDLESQREELESELESLDQRIDVYEPSIQLFQNTNNLRDKWAEKNMSLDKELSSHDDASEQPVSTEDDGYVYVKNIQPEDVFRATGKENIAESDLFADEEENQRLRSNLEELVKNTRKQEYAGLRRRKISKGRSRYSDLKVRLSVASQAIDQIDRDALDFEDLYRDAFDLGASGKRVENPFTSWQRDIGGPWDISLSVFISGVFLDNIRKVVQADGYQAGYQHRLDELGDDILIHHSTGLEDGYYIRRQETLNMEDEEDAAFFLRDEDDIVQDLLDDYIEIVEH